MVKLPKNFEYLSDTIKFVEDGAKKCNYPHIYESVKAICEALIRSDEEGILFGYIKSFESVLMNDKFDSDMRCTILDYMQGATLGPAYATEELKLKLNSERSRSADFSKQNNLLIREKEDLTKNNTELTSKVSDLTKKKDQCEVQQKELTQKKSNLESQISELTQEKDQCETEKSELQARIKEFDDLAESAKSIETASLHYDAFAY